MSVPKLPPPGGLGPPWWSASPVVLCAVDALGRCLERIVEGTETRANIVMAVRAIEAGHLSRMEAVAVLEAVLHRYIDVMEPAVRNLFLVRMLELLDPRCYVLPWNNLLPPRDRSTR